MNDPNQDGCEDDGTGNPGACPLPKSIDGKVTSERYGTLKLLPPLLHVIVSLLFPVEKIMVIASCMMLPI
jgi:hypothetical protein